MTFSLEQALAEYFDNSGGGGVSYGGTGLAGQITGAPTAGSAAPTGSGAGTGSSSGGSVATSNADPDGILVNLFTGIASFLLTSQTPLTLSAAGPDPYPAGGPRSWSETIKGFIGLEPWRVPVDEWLRESPPGYPQYPAWMKGSVAYHIIPFPSPAGWPDRRSHWSAQRRQAPFRGRGGTG